ncbi:MAG TPA: imidazoleglycerol-phosphate dehydratase, partial [Anaerolineae bacterium]
MRSAKVQRKTSETDITLSLNLDGSGQARIATGVGFLDHMLRHIAVHGLFDLDVQATGDLEIDAHHTIED